MADILTLLYYLPLHMRFFLWEFSYFSIYGLCCSTYSSPFYISCKASFAVINFCSFSLPELSIKLKSFFHSKGNYQ